MQKHLLISFVIVGLISLFNNNVVKSEDWQPCQQGSASCSDETESAYSCGKLNEREWYCSFHALPGMTTIWNYKKIDNKDLCGDIVGGYNCIVHCNCDEQGSPLKTHSKVY